MIGLYHLYFIKSDDEEMGPSHEDGRIVDQITRPLDLVKNLSEC
jgi:hypothetical protein